jgi:TRAP-type mannitol/chloroaromatic compound transport system permease small subunit
MIALIWVTGARSLLTFVQNEKYYSVWRPVLWPVLTAITLAYILFVMQIFSEIIKDIICLQRGNDSWLKER